MTEEDKELLLRDLCSRLPYGVKYKDAHGDKEILDIWRLNRALNTILYDDKPSLYLRPMSSMTEEEIKEFRKNSNFEAREAYEVRANDESKIVILQADCDLSVKELDWLNERHFDYRHLIENGLALVAPEGMYN